jgi:hypothetical protein
MSWPIDEDYGREWEMPEEKTCQWCKYRPVCIWAAIYDEYGGSLDTTVCPHFDKWEGMKP